MDNSLGCNTLYPYGRLTDAPTQFGLAAHREALKILCEAGFDGCEFSHYDVLSLEECRELRKECDRLGLQPWSAHAWVQIPEISADVMPRTEALQACLAGAGALGANVMVVHAQHRQCDLAKVDEREHRKQAMLACLRDLHEQAAGQGCVIAIENCADRTDLRFMVETVSELDLPGIGFNIDTGHAVLHGMEPADAIRLMGSRLRTTHLQDNFGERDDHLPPGCGTIDWPSVLTALNEVDYKGMLMVEISDCPPGREPDARADTQLAFDNLVRFSE